MTGVLPFFGLVRTSSICLDYWNFLNDGTNGPMVFVWMPAISIYFCDPDGHYLEFIGILPGKSKSDNEKRVVTYEEWLKIKDE